MPTRLACVLAALFVVGCADTPTAPSSELNPQFGLNEPKPPKLKMPKLKMPKLKMPKLKPPKEPKPVDWHGGSAFQIRVDGCGGPYDVSGEYLLEVEGEPDISSGRVTVWGTAFDALGNTYEFTARTGTIVFEEYYPEDYTESIETHLRGSGGQLLGTVVVQVSIAEDGTIGTVLELVGLCAK